MLIDLQDSLLLACSAACLYWRKELPSHNWSFAPKLHQSFLIFAWKEEVKIHWIYWKTLCVSKKHGGMGLRDLNVFTWPYWQSRVRDSCKTPALFLLGCSRKSIVPIVLSWKHNFTKTGSYVWKNILKGISLIYLGMWWRLEVEKVWANGETTGYQYLWCIEWYEEAKVSELIDMKTKLWK